MASKDHRSELLFRTGQYSPTRYKIQDVDLPKDYRNISTGFRAVADDVGLWTMFETETDRSCRRHLPEREQQSIQNHIIQNFDAALPEKLARCTLETDPAIQEHETSEQFLPSSSYHEARPPFTGSAHGLVHACPIRALFGDVGRILELENL